MCLLYDGSTRRLTESGFMWFYGFIEKPGIEPATPGLQGIALIHYTTGAFVRLISLLWPCSLAVPVLAGLVYAFFVVLCPGTPEGSTGSGSGFKASQKTGQRLKSK